MEYQPARVGLLSETIQNAECELHAPKYLRRTCAIGIAVRSSQFEPRKGNGVLQKPLVCYLEHPKNFHFTMCVCVCVSMHLSVYISIRKC